MTNLKSIVQLFVKAVLMDSPTLLITQLIIFLVNLKLLSFKNIWKSGQFVYIVLYEIKCFESQTFFTHAIFLCEFVKLLIFTFGKLSQRWATYTEICSIIRSQIVINIQFRKIELPDCRKGYVVLFSNHLDFAFVCPMEIITFSG